MRICRSASDATSRAIFTMSMKKTRSFFSRIVFLCCSGMRAHTSAGSV